MKLYLLLPILMLLSLTAYPVDNGSNLPAGFKPANPAKGRHANQLLSGRKSSLLFIENKGQIVDQRGKSRKDIDFKMDLGDVVLFVGDGQLHYQWTKLNSAIRQCDNSIMNTLPEPGVNESMPDNTSATIYRMDVVLQGANKNAKLIAEEKQPYFENYYLPQCPDGITVSGYQKITYRDIYPGIDWVLYTSSPSGEDRRGLKYDFIVHPGADPSQIKLAYNGATGLNIEDGALTAATPFGSITEQKPYSYEIKSQIPITIGRTKTVDSRFLLERNVLSFALGNYDKNKTLVIDPTLQWATYFGGSSNDGGADVSTDANGNPIICGFTRSSNIATIGAYQAGFVGPLRDAYMAKFDKQGQILWATYYGNTDRETFSSIKTDKHGDIYLSCSVTLTGTGISLMKFNANGYKIWEVPVSLNGNTAYGGCVAIDVNGYIYIAGNATDTGLATPGSHQLVSNGGPEGFLIKFDTTGNKIWGTYYGGSGTTKQDEIKGVCCDKDANVYIYGATTNADGIATIGSHKSVYISPSNSDGFLVKFNQYGTRLWGTYFGSAGIDIIESAVCDTTGNIYICGTTASSDGIATPGAHKTTSGLGFIAKFNTGGVQQWGTYYGYSTHYYATTTVQSLALDGSGHLFAGGRTSDTVGIADIDAYQDTVGSDDYTRGDLFLAVFDLEGKKIWGTYFGGDKLDGQDDMHTFSASTSMGLTFNKAGQVFMVSSVASNGMATPGAYQQTHAGGVGSAGHPTDAILASFVLDTILSISHGFADTASCRGDSMYIPYIVAPPCYPGNTFTAQLSDSSGSFLAPVNIGSLASSTSGIIGCQIPLSTVEGTKYRVRVLSSLPADTSEDNGTDISIGANVSLVVSNDTALCEGGILYITAGGTPPGITYNWTGPGGFNTTLQNIIMGGVKLSDGGNYIVSVTLNGCSSNDTVSVEVFHMPLKPSITHNAPLCEGDTLIFNYSRDTDSNTIYSIMGPKPALASGGFASNVTRDYGGQYIISANNNGCITADTTVLEIKPAPVLKLNSNSPLHAGQDLHLSLIIDSATTFLWEGPDGFSSTLLNPVIPNVSTYNSGVYTVTGSLNECTSAVDILVHVIDETEDFVILFPNPNDGRFTIKGKLKADQTIPMVVVNAIGQEIYRDRVKTHRKAINHSVVLPPVANGAYMLHLRVSAKDMAIPFVVGR